MVTLQHGQQLFLYLEVMDEIIVVKYTSELLNSGFNENLTLSVGYDFDQLLKVCNSERMDFEGGGSQKELLFEGHKDQIKQLFHGSRI